MISPISSTPAVPAGPEAVSRAAPRPAAEEPKDSIQLSAQAKAKAHASGDADHDGDSH